MNSNIKKILFTLLFMSLIEPDFFTSIDIIHYYYVAMRVITIVIAFIYLIKNKQVPKVTVIILVYFLIYAISTILNSGDIFYLASYSTYIISFVLWIEIILSNTRHLKEGLFSLNLVYSILVYVNLLFFLLFPEGYVQHTTGTGSVVTRYFLGVYNQFASILIPAVVINVIYVTYRYGRLNVFSYLLIITVAFTFSYFWSATSLVGIALIILYLAFVYKTPLNKMINNIIVFGLFFFLYINIVFLNNLNLFSFVVEKVLNKDLTLSTRTIIWDRAKEMISDSPVIGYGYLSGGRYLEFSETRLRDAHNTLLQLLLQHGVLGILPIISLFVLYIKNTAKVLDNHLTKFILFSLLSAMIMMISEVYSFRFLLLLLLLGIYSPVITSGVHSQQYTFTNVTKIFSNLWNRISNY